MGSSAVDVREVLPARDAAREGTRLALTWTVAAVPLVAARFLGGEISWTGTRSLHLHAAIAVATAVVAGAATAFQWYAARVGTGDARIRLVGIAFLGVAVLEVLHLLVSPGMPGVLGEGSAERAVYYASLGRAWLVATLLAGTSVLAASEHPLLRRIPLLAATLALLAAALVVDAVALPRGAAGGGGELAVAARAAVALVLVGASAAGAAFAFARWRSGGDRTLLRIGSALGLLALGELAQVRLSALHQGEELLGHLYALAAAALVFDRLFVAALLEPYRRLDAATHELATSNAHLDALRAHVQGELASTIARLEETSAREQSARAELEAAFAAAPEAIVVYSGEGSILRTNAAADRLFGYTEEVRRRGMVERWARLRLQTTDGKPLPPDENPIAKALQGETVQGVPLSMQLPGGSARVWISVSAAPRRTADGRLDGAVAAIADVGSLQRLQAQREDLLRAVSHDLRNPLQIILLQAERLQRLLAPTPLEKERTSAGRIAYAAKQMGIMIRDLVEAGRMESGRLALQRQPVELRPFVERLLAQLAGALDVGRVTLDLPEDLPPLDADPARLERVVVNLVGNALKYSPEGTAVRVSARAHDGAVQVSVADRGVGIAPEDVAHVFERFYRGQRTEKSDGLGLGLYIVELLVAAHGGRVWLEATAPGEGSTFTFALPAAPRPG